MDNKIPSESESSLSSASSSQTKDDENLSELSEEDRELIRENLKKRSATENGSTESIRKKVALESLFDDDQEEKKKEEEAPEETSDEELKDFIVEEEEEDEDHKVTEKERQVEEKPIKRKDLVGKKVKALSLLQRSKSHLSYGVWHELMDIFGDGSEYQEMLDSFSRQTIEVEKDVTREEKDRVTETYSDLVIVTEITDQEIAFTLKSLASVTQIQISPSDVRLVLEGLFKDRLELIYLEHYVPELSHLDSATFWVIHDAHWQWKSTQRDRTVCQDRHIIIKEDLDLFETLPDYLTKFGKQALPSECSSFPEPHELSACLRQEVPIVSKIQLDMVALRYALHPQSFEWLWQNKSSWEQAILPECSGTMKIVLERTFQLAAPYFQRFQRLQSLKKQRKDYLRSLERGFINLLQSRPIIKPGSDEFLGCIYVEGRQMLSAIVQVSSGSLSKPMLRNAIPDATLFSDCRKVVIGGQGNILRQLSERMYSDKLDVFFVKPLLSASSSLETKCLHLARLAIDPLTEICAHDPHELLTNCSPDEDEYLRKHCTLPLLAKSRIIRIDEDFRDSEWRQATLRQLVNDNELSKDIVENAQSRSDLKNMVDSEAKFRNIAGFIYFPQSTQPLDNTSVHPADYGNISNDQLTADQSIQDFHKGSIEATDEEIISMMMEMPVESLKRGLPLSGTVIKADYPYALYLKLADGSVEGLIRRPRKKVPVGQSIRGLIDRIDGRRFRIEMHPDEGDFGKQPAEEEQRTRELRKEDTLLMSRASGHPFFRGDLLSGADVENYFVQHGHCGDIILRVSRRRAGHLALAWKITPSIVSQLDLEAYKGRWHVSGLGDGSSSFEDLDEVISRLMDPVIQLIQQITSSQKFMEPPSHPDSNIGSNDKAASKIVEEMLSNISLSQSQDAQSPQTQRVIYCIWLSREHPGLRAFISSLPKPGKYLHEPITLKLGSSNMIFRGKSYSDLPTLVNYWKQNYLQLPTKPDNYYGGRRH